MSVRQVPQIILLEVPLDVILDLVAIKAFVLLVLGIVGWLLLSDQGLHDILVPEGHVYITI